MLSKIHRTKFKEAIKSKKLILTQYSCSDLCKKPINITSFFALDYFTDEEFGLENDMTDFRSKLKKYFDNHKEYYFVLWNYNITYSYRNLGIFSDEEISELDKRAIDLDDVFKLYAEDNDQKYVRKVDGGFDKRYYFALLNNIEVRNGWIYGNNERSVKNVYDLLQSSRVKTKIMGELISKYSDKTLVVNTDEQIIKKSKGITGVRGKLIYQRKNIKLLIIAILIYLFGLATDLLVNLIANWISR